MSREDTYIGLNDWTREFVNRRSVIKEEINISPYFGVCEDFPFHKYTLPDGRAYFENVQADPWASGPTIFIALKNEKGNWIPKSLWRKSDIHESY